MTYLDIMNNVLRRMREDEVSNVTENTYAKMVGDFINDAKESVEVAWDWSSLRNSLTISTSVAGGTTYSLAGTQDKGKIINLINDTSNVFMEYRPISWFDDKRFNQDTVSGSPEYYTYNGVDSSGDAKIEVYPTPDDAYTLKANIVIRNTPLVNNTDTLDIPSAPVMHLALAMLVRERGETGGQMAAEYFAIADRYLSDAIAMDAQKHPDETVWYSV